MIEKHGRKFFLTLLCIATGLLVTLLALFLGVAVPTEFTNVLIASAMFYNGANAAIEWKHAGNVTNTRTREEQVLRTLEERRNVGEGWEESA